MQFCAKVRTLTIKVVLLKYNENWVQRYSNIVKQTSNTLGNSKILFILHLPPPVHGAAMVGKYIHDSESVNSKFGCHYINLTTASSLEDMGHVGWKKVKAFWFLLQKIRHSVQEQRPDLVYVTPNAKGGAFYKDFVVVMMLKQMGCRVVVHYHNKGVVTRQDQWLDNLLYRRFFKGLKVILLAEALYPDIQKYVKREDVYICSNGIPMTEEKKGTHEDNVVPRLLFLSNLLVDKGVMILLDALKILKDKNLSFVCDFVGGETEDINAKRFADEISKRGLNEIALYKGKKYGEDKDEEFANSDVFVFPTFYHNECFPLVLLEAMQHGLPIVTTDEGGIADIVKDGENGFIVERQSSQQLAEKIAILIDDKELRSRLGERGYQLFHEKFTLKVFEERFVETLTEIIRNREGDKGY